MIYFDTTKSGRAGHRSGLTRVSKRLREALGDRAQEVIWDEGVRTLQTWDRVPLTSQDWFFTAELFSEEERPGFRDFLRERPCGLAAIFHDAIPLKHPEITWPQSVARHPSYMKDLARFDRVWAVSRTSRDELTGLWQWQRVEQKPPVEVIALGADFVDLPRVQARRPAAPGRPKLLCLGIIEPRKNQSFLLDVCEALWREGEEFELHVVGRVNPHFGKPIASRLRKLQRTRRAALHFHEAASDRVVTELFATARATVFPTVAEGCGLPLLESLWMGVPCVCSDLPVLRENADGGGCLPVAANDRAAWHDALRQILTDEKRHAQLTSQAMSRPLPTWQRAADVVHDTLRQSGPIR